MICLFKVELSRVWYLITPACQVLRVNQGAARRIVWALPQLPFLRFLPLACLLAGCSVDQPIPLEADHGTQPLSASELAAQCAQRVRPETSITYLLDTSFGGVSGRSYPGGAASRARGAQTASRWVHKRLLEREVP